MSGTDLDEKSATAATTPSIHSSTIDDKELETAGYTRAMPRRFDSFSMVALSFDLTCTWIGVGASVGLALTQCSSAGVIWALLVAAFFIFIETLGMAELASAYPVAGAQYFWAFMVAGGPEGGQWAPFASFVTGWMNVFGWWLGVASVANFTSAIIFALAVLWNPSYQRENWHQYLLYVLIIWLSAALNIVGSRIIPIWNKSIMTFSMITVLASFLTLLICSRGRYQSAEFIFTDTTNSTGWPSTGFAFMLSILNGMFAYLGTDVPAHMAEEIPSPSKNVPRAMLLPILFGTVLAWPLGVALLASITDLTAVLETSTGFPLIEIFLQATGSRSATTFFGVLWFIGMFAAGAAIMTASSRTIWAISRDGVLPFSKIWTVVSPKWQVPSNAMILTAIVTTIYGLIFIGSANVFSSMISAVVIFQQTTCVIPLAILLCRGRQTLPARYFRISEPWGMLVNVAAVAWVAFIGVLACFPVFYPVTSENLEGMNWISVLSVFLMLLILVLWFTTKKNVFRGPKVDMEKMHRRRAEALGIAHRTSDAERDGILMSQAVKH